MFETAVLSYGSPTKRVWATCAGFTGQALLVGFALLAPMIWPQVMPRVAWTAITLAPPPPPPPPKAMAAVPQHAHVVPVQSIGNHVFVPVNIPTHIAQIIDPPDLPAGPAGPGGVEGGVPGGVPNGVVSGILSEVTRIVPVVKLPEPVVREARAATVTPAAKPPRISVLQAATPIHRVDPVYPALAKQARIQGTVELMGVLGVDGRIHELRVVRGHPLLIDAAMAAVKQWVYAPTILNGQAVEVQAPILVNFILNH
jgi:protein TonB